MKVRNDMEKYQVMIDEQLCIGCGLCSEVCVANNLKMANGTAKTVLEDCLLCAHCQAICPQQAIWINGYEQSVKQQTKTARLDSEEVLDVLRFRRSIRHFKQQEVPHDIILQILEAGRLTHTAKNTQDLSFVVLQRQKDEMEQMAVSLFRKVKPFANVLSAMNRSKEIDDHFFFFKAPLVIVVLAKNQTNGILAAQNMEFVAEANGLGCLYSGFFTIAANVSRKIRNALGVPKGKKVAMTLVMGYPSVKYKRSAQRKTLNATFK